jgi:hypothetical protein
MRYIYWITGVPVQLGYKIVREPFNAGLVISQR